MCVDGVPGFGSEAACAWQEYLRFLMHGQDWPSFSNHNLESRLGASSALRMQNSNTTCTLLNAKTMASLSMCKQHCDRRRKFEGVPGKDPRTQGVVSTNIQEPKSAQT